MTPESPSRASLVSILEKWSGLPAREFESSLSPEWVRQALEILAGDGSWRQGDVLKRRLGFALMERMSPALRRRFTSWVKSASKTGRFSRDIQELFFISWLEKLKKPVDAASRFRVIVTHDVDWPECYAHLPDLAAQEESAGIRSTLNFLTGWGYRAERPFLQELDGRGFEIGLHGLDHDAALGFRSKARIREKLARARDLLGFMTRGFRAPALAYSRALFEALEELGFIYDSSRPVFAGSAPGVQSVFPYRIPGLKLTELPLALQDSELFRDRRLSDSEALALTARLMADIKGLGGCFVFNGHPGLLREHPEFYSGFLNLIKREKVVTALQEVNGDPAVMAV